MSGPFCFAWSGGAIEDQVTLVTNGTTHGARLKLVTLVGDTDSDGQQLLNLASTEGLQVGTLYALAGEGIADPTYFIYDDSALAGLPGFVNLTTLTASAVESGTFRATESIILGAVIGTLAQGSNNVTLQDVPPDLTPGLYGIAGTGIGETNIPIGTTNGTSWTTGGGIMIIGSAFLNYHGGGAGNLQIIAATPHTRETFDGFGQPITHTTFTIAWQDVRATASGEFPLEISGFPTGDPYSITAIPTAALAGLAPGLVYNISGNGIQVGTTFVAPGGGDSIALDLFATSSEINAILTITGPRAPDAPFDPAVHNRFDEDIVSLELSQEEGGFATLDVRIKNPQVGLLATGRRLWCWLSWDQAWTPDGTAAADLVPLFNGRLVGIPKLQAGEIVQLQFLARPDDFNAQKLALASSLSVLPYYDPIWYSEPAVSPDTILETYSALFHIDRVSLGVTTSDILDGEAGTIDIGEDQAIYENFSLSYQQPPLVAVAVTGTVTWQQQAEGLIDITGRLISAFHGQGSRFSLTFPTAPFNRTANELFPESRGILSSTGGGGLAQTLNGDGMMQDWPKPGVSIGGGWSVSSRLDASGAPLNYIKEATINPNGGWLPAQSYNVLYSGSGYFSTGEEAGFGFPHGNLRLVMDPLASLRMTIPMNTYKIRMVLEYRADRKRTETVTAVVAAGVQPALSDPAENDRDAISLTSEYVGLGVDPDGTVPIGNPAYRSYFKTARGAASFEHLLFAARAKLRARARAVDVTFAVDWRTAVGITLRHNVALTDRRLPGGGAVGKVKGYKLTVGDGKMVGEFTIGCSIGTGNVAPFQSGSNSYVDDGYVNDYQRVAGAQLALGEGDLYYETLDDFAVLDDGLDLTNLTADQALNECRVINGIQTQINALEPFQGQVTNNAVDPRNALGSYITTVTIDLKPVQGGGFNTNFFPSVTALTLPKTIDLSATSGERH